jgi:hypothetical protein
MRNYVYFRMFGIRYACTHPIHAEDAMDGRVVGAS